MNKTKEVRLGVIGMGNMGRVHAQSVLDGKVPGLRLTAVADTRAERLEAFATARAYPEGSALIQSGEVDAVLIATPHYSHTTLGAEALAAGLHVLVESRSPCIRPTASA